jgi:hypothetical protein
VDPEGILATVPLVDDIIAALDHADTDEVRLHSCRIQHSCWESSWPIPWKRLYYGDLGSTPLSVVSSFFLRYRYDEVGVAVEAVETLVAHEAGGCTSRIQLDP